MERRLVPIGKVVKLHGIKGKVKLHYFSDDLNAFLRYRDVIIEDRSGVPRTYEILEATPQPPRLILKLKGIETIEDAEPLVNREVFVEREALPDPEEGEHYWIDLLGMNVARSLEGFRRSFPPGPTMSLLFVARGERSYSPRQTKSSRRSITKEA
jgi:16S rRNA processing protein RimM